MSDMSNTDISNNGVNEAGVYNEALAPSRCRGLGRAGPIIIK